MATNVYYLGIARMAGQGIIVASFSYSGNTDIAIVQQVLEQPNMSTSPGKHYTFSNGQLAWHLISDDLGLIYILICALKYPQQCAHMCLEELQRTFINKFGDRATTAMERSLDKTFNPTFKQIAVKYDNVAEIDKLSAVQKKVDAVKLVMQENVEIALQNCVKLDVIQAKAEELQQGAAVFNRDANRLRQKMWWKNMTYKIVIATVVLVILGIIIGVIVAESKASGN